VTDFVAGGAALVDVASGTRLAGDGLTARIAAVAQSYAGIPAGTVFVRAYLDLASVLRYLGAWTAKRPVALLDPSLPDPNLAELVRRYRPAVVCGCSAAEGAPAGYRAAEHRGLGPVWLRDSDDGPAPHPDLAVLLATSGSTGDPKLVRLSRDAIVHNAHAITASLHLSPDEVAPTSLPLFYSFGMSVLNSHLAAGATVVIADGGVLSRDFWGAVDRYGATSLAGVPYHYEMLARIRWKADRHPSLRTLTQAGGRLRPELISVFHEQIRAVGGGMYVMYGQTEAGPRMTTLPASRLPEKLGSVGPPLRDARLCVVGDDGTETEKPDVTGEIVYHGPNVMLGYAESAADLARGDECGGALRTGDVGHLDDEGHLWVTGRLRRIGKVFGVRVNLDDIERMLRDRGPVAVVAGPDTVVIWCEGADEAARRDIAGAVAERLRLHRTGFDVRSVQKLPLLSSGKVDYRSLEGM
jgi:acyl-CoA synthetase (AMP-forming)/AMP-acid ligase II